MKAKNIENVLVTGGAGFVGSHTVDLLVENGYEVTVLDSLTEQVHRGKMPNYMDDKAKFVKGDIRDKNLLERVIEDMDAIVHLASAVGVGQSMYQIEGYIDCNTKGTAMLLDVLINGKNNVKKIVTASSMSIYGEGKYLCDNCGQIRYPSIRTEKQLKNMMWDPLCPDCGSPLKPLPTDEDKPLVPTSIYAMSKRHQEEMCLLVGKTYGIRTVALRYFNIYGPRQSLSNPYTGVCAIFLSRILNQKSPYIFEDGDQTRDFVHVEDIAKANLLSLEKNSAVFQSLNVGTGKPVSIKQVAEMLIEDCGIQIKPYVPQKYRAGDVRHCYADITKIKRILGYTPQRDLKEGLKELAEWAEMNKWGTVDLFDDALRELDRRNLSSQIGDVARRNRT